MPERVIRALDGKRGSFLLVGGVAYAFIGLSYVTAPTAGRQAAFSWLPEMLAPDRLGWAWVAGGVLAVVCALLSGRRRGVEPVGFAALMLCPIVWVCVFLGAQVTGAHPYGWVSAVAYGVMSSWSWVAAGWPNPVTTLTGPQRVVQAAEQNRGDRP